MMAINMTPPTLQETAIIILVVVLIPSLDVLVSTEDDPCCLSGMSTVATGGG